MMWYIEKKKNTLEGCTKILVCTTYRGNIWEKKTTRSSQSLNLGKILQCWKTLVMLRFLGFWYNIFAITTSHTYLPPCFLQQGSHNQIQGHNNFQPKNLENLNNNFLFWLRDWLFERLAETSLNQFEQKLPKITLHGN